MAQDKDQKTLNVPPLRFTGFTDEWKKTTLGEITTNFNLRNKEQIDYPMFSVTNNRGFIPQSEQFEDREMKGEDIKAYKVIHHNDFAYNPARINVGSIAKYNGYEPCMISSLYVCFKANNEVNEDWLMHLLRTPKVQYYYQLNGEGGVRIYLFYPNFARIRTSIPSIEEQKKIAKILSIIDERIATQNKIIEDLKKLKSAIIDKLLGRVQTAQSDRMVKLGEIGKFTRGLTYSAEDIVEDGGIVVVRANNLSNGEAVNFYNEIVRVDKPISGSQLLKYGDMVICMANGSSALVGKASYYNETTDSIATIGAFCGIYRSDKKIVRWLLQTNKYKRVIHRSLQGGNGAIANLTPNDILGLSFIIPKQEPSIVELLQGFDEKLDIEISLLHSLQKEKQYLLSQMFI